MNGESVGVGIVVVVFTWHLNQSYSSCLDHVAQMSLSVIPGSSGVAVSTSLVAALCQEASLDGQHHKQEMQTYSSPQGILPHSAPNLENQMSFFLSFCFLFLFLFLGMERSNS